MKVIWSNLAKSDLKEIWNYIAKDSIYYADKVINEITLLADKLEENPKMGRKISQKYSDNIREVIHGKYKIIYEIQDDIVYIRQIAHSARNIKFNF